MKRKNLLYTALILVGILWILNFFAGKLYLYWTIWWFDMLMHLLGGITLGFFILYFMKDVSKRSLITAFLIVMVLGSLWEIFEYAAGISPAEEGSNYAKDTTEDLVLDGVGAAAVMLGVKRRALKSS